MNILKNFLLGLIILSAGIAQLDAAKRQLSNDFSGHEPATKKQKPELHPDLIFGPYDPKYYQLIEQELNRLDDFFIDHEDRTIILADHCNVPILYECFFACVNTAEKLTGKKLLTRTYDGKQIAPTLYTLLSTKIRNICSRMELDASTITLALVQTHRHGNFNPVTDPNKKIITLPVGFIKLMAWMEGSNLYRKTESLIDGIIAHELAHIFHQHTCSVKNELEADATATLSLQNPENITAVNIIGLAEALFSIPMGYRSLDILRQDTFFIACIITSALIKKYPNLGALGFCITSGHQDYNIHKALRILEQTDYPQEYVSNSDNPKKLDKHDLSIICSLIYDELLSRCLECVQMGPLPETAEYLNHHYFFEETTHPGPRKRNEAICKVVYPKKQKLVLNTIKEHLLKSETL